MANDGVNLVNPSARIEAACDRFETDWRAGASPRIEDALAAADGVDADVLFRALLAVELELRVKNHERVTSAEYKTRFPDRVQSVIEVFREFVQKRRPGSGDTSVVQESIKEEAATLAPREKPIVIQPGLSQIGRFVLTELLGEGAFGQVFRARDPNLDRDVAIKTPRPGVINNEADRERFLREARALATVQHPNVCPVYEVGEDNGRLYTVMAFVSGKTLSEAIKERKTPMPKKQAALIVRKLALALEAAHAKGVIHRDLKPANIMFDRERKDVVVMDFGLARRAAAIESELTLSGFVLGTPAYMAPEQAKGDIKTVGPCSDIYSLGVILYEMLAGRRPFSGAAGEVIGKVQHVVPDPPSKWRADVDSKLEAICNKAMAKDPAERYGSMNQLAAALSDWLKSGPTREGEAPAEPNPAGSAGVSPSQNSPSQSDESIGLQQVFAVLSDQRKQTVAAVEAAVKTFRPPWWMWLAGTGFAGLIAVLGIIFFARTPTATILIQVEVDLTDKALRFVLDDKPISAGELANPIELKVGEHELTVWRGEKLEKWIKFSVKGGRNPGFQVDDVKVPEPQPSGYDQSQQAIVDRLKSIGASLTEVPNGNGKTLTGIYFAQNNSVDDKLVESLTQFPTLQSVCLHGCPKVTDRSVAVLGALPKLTVTGFAGTPITDKALEHIGGIQTLTDLDISSNSRFTAAGIGHLKALTNLRRLAIICSPITDESIAHFSKMSSLQDVNLHETAISDRALSYLGQLPKLSNLNLGKNKIGDESLKQIATSKTLKVLNLERTGVTDQCVPTLSAIKTLRTVNLTGTQITPEGLNQLRKALPNCNITPKPPTMVQKPNADGFVPLFNGKDLTGWAADGAPAWRAENGELVGTHVAPRSRDVWLLTDRDFREYILRCEFRKEGDLKNTGIALRAPAPGTNTTEQKLRVILGNSLGNAAVPMGTLCWSRGQNSHIAANAGVTIPADGWNTAEIELRGPNLTVSINGTQVLRQDMSTLNDGANTYLQIKRDQGRIGINSQNGVMRYRKIEIKELTPTADAKAPAPVKNSQPAPQSLPRPDRAAAAAVLKHGGKVVLRTARGNSITVSRNEPLPAGEFWIRQIDLNECLGLNDEAMSQFSFAKLDELVGLNVANTNIGNAGIMHLRDCARLASVNLTATKITGAGLDHLATLPALESLTLDVCKGLDDAGMRHIRGLTRLKALTFCQCSITDAGLVHLQPLVELEELDLLDTPVQGRAFADLKSLTKLRDLSLRATRVDNAGLAAAAGLPAITNIDAEDGAITSAGIKLIKGNSTLHWLGLANTHIDDSALPFLATLPNLDSVKLAGTPITGNGLARLHDFPVLTAIDLSRTKISDRSLSHLASVKSLRKIRLVETAIGDNGIAHLVNCPQLTSIELDKTKVTPAGLANLRKKLPNCVITPQQ